MSQKQNLKRMNKTNKKIIVEEKTKDLANQLSSHSLKSVEHYFPIDRFFIEEHHYLEKILKADKLEFIFYNLENNSATYTIQLFICLPELWEKIEHDDLLSLIENFTSSFSFYSLIGFTYKYLEIDLLDEIFLSKNVNIKFKKDCLNYFSKILATFYMDENDLLDFNNNVFGIEKNKWDLVKKKIHNNNEFTKSLSISELSLKLTKFG